MKSHLIRNLEELHDNLVDYRYRILRHLNDADVTEELDDDTIEDLQQIRTSLSYVEDRISEVNSQIAQRVYCIQVTTNVETNIKVLAKNEDDAIEWACETADKRIRLTLAREHDVYYDSTGEVLGHESQSDDEADEEYDYDD